MMTKTQKVGEVGGQFYKSHFVSGRRGMTFIVCLRLEVNQRSR